LDSSFQLLLSSQDRMRQGMIEISSRWDVSTPSCGGTQRRFKVTQVFGQFGFPGHCLPGTFRVFQGQDFGV